MQFDSCVSNDVLEGCVQVPAASLAGPVKVAVSPDGANVYATTAYGDAITTFTRNASTGKLTFQSCISNVAIDGCTTAPARGIQGPVDIVVSPDGRNVYASAVIGGLITFDRNPSTGELTFDACLSLFETPGCEQAETMPLVYSVGLAISADGRDVYVSSLYGEAVTTLSRDPSSGDLSNPSCIASNADLAACTQLPTDSLGGAALLKVSPDDKNVYVSTATPGGVATFSRNPANGALTFVSCLTSSELAGCATAPVSTLRGAVAVQVSSDGDNVYVTSPETSAVTMFTRNQANGMLTYGQCLAGSLTAGCTQTSSASLSGAGGLSVSPDGASVFVAGSTSNAVTSFSRDPANGRLAEVGCLSNDPLGQCTVSPVASLEGALGMQAAPDGTSLYVASTSGQVTAFSRTVPAPGVTSVGPGYGTFKGGTEVTIRGYGFLPGATATIAGVACTSATVLGASELTCRTGRSVPGRGTVIVTNPNGLSGTLSNGFIYTPLQQFAKAGCIKQPDTLPLAGTRILLKPHCVTNAGAPVKVSVRAALASRGDLVTYRLIRSKNGKVKIRTYGYPLRAKIRWTAPATDIYSPLVTRAAYRS